MEKLITIKPLDISEVKSFTASPITKTRKKISQSTAVIFTNFNEIKKGAIEEEELLAIKSNLDVDSLPHYEEILTKDKLKNKIDKVNEILKKYGYTNLYISYDNLTNLLGNVDEELQNEIEMLKVENDNLTKENISLKEALQSSNPFLIPNDDKTENDKDERKLVA